jgi:hypothetical protein
VLAAKIARAIVGDPPDNWLACVGIGIYLTGTGSSCSRRAACRASFGRCCSSRRSSSPGCGPS